MGEDKYPRDGTPIPLLPCPFCGGAAVGIRLRNKDELSVFHADACAISDSFYRSIDFHCNGEIHPVEEYPVIFKAWNTRTNTKGTSNAATIPT